jgi:YegS/Rv2252/BmrU family lipid kinase
MKPLLIVNPHAGGGRTGRIFDKMRRPIERAVGGFDTVFTERARHAVTLARDAALEGRETVVAVGGDGAIHEVVNGLMLAHEQGKTQTRLGIIGTGTGGDFRRSLAIEHRLDKYGEVIARGVSRNVDVARFSYATHDDAPAHGYFVNILSVGIGGLVDLYVAESRRRLGGTFAYFCASLRGLVTCEVGVLSCTIRCNGESREEEIRTRSLAICNGRFFGSGMHIAPMAKLDDGLLDVVDLGDAPRLRFLVVSSQMYTGSHLRSEDVRHFRCDKLEIELLNNSIRDRFLLDIDGEPLGRLPISVEILRGALPVLAPPA